LAKKDWEKDFFIKSLLWVGPEFLAKKPWERGDNFFKGWGTLSASSLNLGSPRGPGECASSAKSGRTF